MVKRSAAKFWDDTKANTLDEDVSHINGKLVPKGIVDATKSLYTQMLTIWDEFEERNPGATPHDLETAKRFMMMVARACQGVIATAATIARCNGTVIKAPSLSYISHKWKMFICDWARRPGNCKISPEVTLSITNYIKTILVKKIPLTIDMWQNDGRLHPRSIVQDFAALVLFIYTSGRVSEYFESVCRRGSGRGLLYKHIDFAIFKNKKGQAELAICTTRDAKGITNKPHKRLQHAMYEDMAPLFANPVLPMLAIALTDGAFKDYTTFKEIFAIPPLANGALYHLEIHKSKQELPFFQVISHNGPTGKIQSASSFGKQLVELGHRAGYRENITVHDIRAETFVKADDNGYSIAERMKFAGHTNPNTFSESYMPQMSTVNGQSSYWGGKRRTIHLDVFRGLSLHYHPQLLQSLPAKLQADLESRPDFVALSSEIESLNMKAMAATTDDEQHECQKNQRLNLTSDSADGMDSIGRLPTYFKQVCYLDPPRHRLASSLFLNSPLRSKEGRSVLRDLIILYKENPEVGYHPSLQPKMGCCPVAKCALQMNRFVSGPPNLPFSIEDTDRGPLFYHNSIKLGQRWSHIYKCYKEDLENQYSFAQLCFQCDEWITTETKWQDHCQRHLDKLETLPVQCDILTYRRTLASAGFCHFCLFDPNKSATERMYQWLHHQP
ncbi:MAG: hypothetical protein M1840_003737 [Geoglossum simile]|nr:MAG: hypothetical protein M1840_003737 [Geoglossum simile]